MRVIKVPFEAVVAAVLSLILTMALFLGAVAIFDQYSKHFLYPAYMESLQLESGDIGAAPTEDTPLATSIEDLEQMDVFYTEGRLRTGTAYTAGGKAFYEFEFPNGDSVLVRVDLDTVEKLEGTTSRLPVGKWLPLTPEEAEEHHCTYVEDRDHYMEMRGDFAKIQTEGQFMVNHPFYKKMTGVIVLSYLVWFVLFDVLLTKRKKRRQAQA